MAPVNTPAENKDIQLRRYTCLTDDSVVEEADSAVAPQNPIIAMTKPITPSVHPRAAPVSPRNATAISTIPRSAFTQFCHIVVN